MRRIIVLLGLMILAQNGGNAVGVQRTLKEVAEGLKELSDRLIAEVQALADRDGPEDETPETKQ